MASKILISALANKGKTTLLKTLEDVFVVAHDGKKYPFPQPHTNVDTFDSIQELIALVNSKLGMYKEKYSELPKTIVFDSVSKIFDTIASNCQRKYKGFEIWKYVNEEITSFTSYIENVLIPNGLNVVIVSHAVWNADTASYELVAQGQFAKRGAFLAEVDNAVFIDVKNNKRTVYHRSAKLPARSTLSTDILPDDQPVEEYSLQDHINKLNAIGNTVAEFTF